MLVPPVGAVAGEQPSKNKEPASNNDLVSIIGHPRAKLAPNNDFSVFERSQER
jgi:hypothetical protein